MNKIKGIIFDLDGVLVDTRELHYVSLNHALSYVKFPEIKREDHIRIYDGRPTKTKLDILTTREHLPKELHRIVWEKKQEFTIDIINSMQYDEEMREILGSLRRKGYKLAVASNSIRETVKMMLLRKGFLEFFDFYISNEDIKHPKPHPECYLRCINDWGFLPKEVMIIEDSRIGREGATNAGAHLCAVSDYNDVSLKKIITRLDTIEQNTNMQKWDNPEMNVLIPMAGAGSRFAEAGYTFPKPLIEVSNFGGKPMIQVVVENLNIKANYIFLVQKAHYEKYYLKTLLNLIAPGCKIIQVEGLTEGACCTTLLAKEFIDNDKPLIVANSDQFIEWNSNEFMYSMVGDKADAGIVTFKASHPKWSYAKTDSDGFVTAVAEKQPISDTATVGIYYWSKGSDYVKYAEQMISKNIRVKNEFYVCPVFNEAVLDGKKIKTFDIEHMWGLGDPNSLETFLEYGPRTQ
jgi:HAD superfamily hydrolase (TIGR01509 family)